jgi:hypothetical protein
LHTIGCSGLGINGTGDSNLGETMAFTREPAHASVSTRGRFACAGGRATAAAGGIFAVLL